MSDFDWGGIADLVKPLAPILGTALGGPMGGVAGQILASALGTDNSPGAVGTAIQAGGAAVTNAIQNAEADAAARWDFLKTAVQADAQQGSEINQTMRAEYGHVSWWHWRNLLGYVVVLWTISPLPLVSWAVWHSDATKVNMVLGLAAALLPYFGIVAALLGYVASDTTRRVTTAMIGEHPNTVLGQLVGSLVKKK